MTQRIIRENLIRFLQLIPNLATAEGVIAEKSPLIDILSDSKGLCFGITVTERAMNSIKKRNWFLHALQVIATTPPTPKNINLEINLPDADGPCSLYSLYQRILNYVVITHTVRNEKIAEFFVSGGIDQNDALFMANYLEILDPMDNKKINTLQTSYVFDDSYSAASLEFFLKDEVFAEDTIFVITFKEHCVSIGYENNKWYCYDTNNDHRTVESMTKVFDSKFDLAFYLIKVYGSELALFISSFKKKDIDQILFNSTLLKIRFLKDQGAELHQLLKHAPDDMVMKLFTDIRDNSDEEEQYNQISNLLFALLHQDKSKQSGIFALIPRKPEIFSLLIDILNNSNVLETNPIFAASLIASRKNGNIALELLIKNKEEHCKALLDYCIRYPKEFANAFATAFSTPNGLSIFIEKHTMDLDKLLYLLKHATPSSELLDAMLATNTLGINNLNLISIFIQNNQKSYGDFCQLLQSLSECPNSQEKVMEALTTADLFGTSLWHTLLMIEFNLKQDPPVMLELIIDCLDSTSDNALFLITALTNTKNTNGKSGIDCFKPFQSSHQDRLLAAFQNNIANSDTNYLSTLSGAMKMLLSNSPSIPGYDKIGFWPVDNTKSTKDDLLTILFSILQQEIDNRLGQEKISDKDIEDTEELNSESDNDEGYFL